MLTPKSNELIAKLSDYDYSLISSHLQLISLVAGEIVFEPGDCIDQTYFPVNALIAISRQLSNGLSIDTAIIGNEGLIGIKSITMGKSTHKIYASATGLAYKIKGTTLRQLIEKSPSIAELFIFASTQMIYKMSVEIACSNFHSIEARLARWLLTRDDLNHLRRINTTHQFIADSMGVRRETITNASSKLTGLRNCRGLIEISDRDILVKQACECYFHQRESYDSQQSFKFNFHHD